jgi:exosortase/archaeosortase family protein
METFLGYPVRLATAAIVRDGFSALGVSSLGVETILVFENGVSQVDLPCSGVKSLWAGGLFLLAATWIDRRQINLRWLAAALGFTIFLLAANLARVGLLVGIGEVAGWRLAAELLHVPLGVLGFAAACAAALLLLRWTGSSASGSDEGKETTEINPGHTGKLTPSGRAARKRGSWRKFRFVRPPVTRRMASPFFRGPSGRTRHNIRAHNESDHQAWISTKIEPARLDSQAISKEGDPAVNLTAGLPPRPGWLAPLLGGALLALSLLYAPRPAAAETGLPAPWIFPDGLEAEPWPLTTAELEWLGSTGALSGDRWRFTWEGISGTMLFVTGNSWRAQHRPERCFEVYGLKVLDSHPYLAAPDFPLQRLRLGDAEGRDLYSAAYWFQSPDQITSDYGARIWSDLAPERDSWVLVTVLFDDIYGAGEPAPAGFYQALRQSLALSLGEGASR